MNFNIFFFKKKFIVILFLFFNIEAIKITRAIISWDNHPDFAHFWPIVSKAWKELIGVKPTLIFIGPKTVHLNTQYGEIVYFEPIKNLPTSFQAMAIRPLAAALFPNDVCIISDLDMIPINKEYFQKTVEKYSDDNFIVFYPNFYKSEPDRYMMCYNVAKGSTFAEVFKIKNETDIRRILNMWYKIFFPIYNYKTDEKMLHRYLYNWKPKEKNLRLLNLKFKRLNREKWEYIPEKISKYADAHILRPYEKYKKELDELVSLLNLRSKL
jgi:hypothetical protein